MWILSVKKNIGSVQPCYFLELSHTLQTTVLTKLGLSECHVMVSQKTGARGRIATSAKVSADKRVIASEFHFAFRCIATV